MTKEKCKYFFKLNKFLLVIFFSVIFFDAAFSQSSSQSGWINIKNFGATGDGKTLDTRSINNAIDAAVKAGGGTVLFPAGTYLSYSIHLKLSLIHISEPTRLG